MIEITTTTFIKMTGDIQSLRVENETQKEEIKLLKIRLLKAESDNFSAVGVNRALEFKLREHQK